MLGVLFGFTGRLSRPGFWEVLFSIVLIDVLLVLGRMSVADSGVPWGPGPSSGVSLALLAAMPWVLGVFTVWSLLAAMVKRCHDRGRSGALILIALIPVIGWLWLLIDLFVLEGEERRNRYGRAPHSLAVEDTPRAGFDWGAEPAAAPEPLFAAAPSEPPPPEPPPPEPGPPVPVLADVGAVDVHVQEPHVAPEPEPLAPEEHPAVSHLEPAAESAPLVTDPEPEPQFHHVEAVEPEALAESPAESQPDLPLELDHSPTAEVPERGRSDLRPLMLDRI